MQNFIQQNEGHEITVKFLYGKGTTATSRDVRIGHQRSVKSGACIG